LEEADPTPVTRLSLRRSRTVAAVLSFLIPGTGQFLSGRVAAGLLFLVPFALLVVGVLVAANGDRYQILGVLAQPSVLTGLIVLDAALLLWRAVAIIDAWWGRGHGGPKTTFSVIVLVLLLAITGATHYAAGSYLVAWRATVEAVFASTGDEDDGFEEIPESSALPASPLPGPSASGSLAPTPTPTPPPGPLADGRLDVLLVGGDEGPDRWGLRTDTMMVLSVDAASGEAALFSIPRNMVNVPLPKESRGAFACGCYPRLINSLYVYASGHPGSFPGKDSIRGYRAVQLAIGQLIGRKLDGMVVVKLQGFVRLINAIDGLTITVPESVYDARYPLEDGSGYVTVSIPAGKQHMTGRKALMYARSRHQDSDYGRMQRQQIVITAIGNKLRKEPLLLRLPELLDIAKDNLWTNLKQRDLPALAELADRTDLKGMKKVRFIPPKYPAYLNTASIKRIRSVVDNALD
jgi:LCP family protein required for cell wall assembly